MSSTQKQELVQFLLENGFTTAGKEYLRNSMGEYEYTTPGKYFTKDLKNDWYINVEWLGDNEYPRVNASHRSQLTVKKTGQLYGKLGTMDHTWFNRAGIVSKKNYVRNKETGTWPTNLIPAAIELLEYRLK
jgi:hypothetical protein